MPFRWKFHDNPGPFFFVNNAVFFGAVTWGPLFFGVKSMGNWGEISSIEIPLNEPSPGRLGRLILVASFKAAFQECGFGVLLLFFL